MSGDTSRWREAAPRVKIVPCAAATVLEPDGVTKT